VLDARAEVRSIMVEYVFDMTMFFLWTQTYACMTMLLLVGMEIVAFFQSTIVALHELDGVRGILYIYIYIY
jgi:hypothetical protein